eukprot:scaffold21992_cov100-Phaeocystis_antarctica.AAC.1
MSAARRHGCKKSRLPPSIEGVKFNPRTVGARSWCEWCGWARVTRQKVILSLATAGVRVYS